MDQIDHIEWLVLQNMIDRVSKLPNMNDVINKFTRFNLKVCAYIYYKADNQNSSEN